MKRFFCIMLAIMFALSTLSGCSAGAAKKKNLPQEISQADWDDARQEIKLSTGLTMSYVEMGDPEGPVVILQHGTTDNSRIWSLSAPFFCDAGFHLYLTDLRGQGCSSQPDGFYTLIDYACDLEAFLDAKKVDKAIMVGQSLGAFAVQAFMLMFPERCEKVVLVATGVADETYTATVANAFNAFSALPDDGHPSDEFIESWYTNECDVPEEFMTYIKKESQRLPGKVWKNIFGGAAASNLSAMYPFIDSSIPTLILHGAKDPMMSEEMQIKLRETMPFASYLEYEGVGHNIHIEIPEKFAGDVIDWIGK